MDLRDDLLAFVNGQISLNTTVPIGGATDLLLTGLVDSFGVVEIVAWLEQRAEVAIDPVDIVIDNFRTVDRIVALVDRVRSGRV